MGFKKTTMDFRRTAAVFLMAFTLLFGMASVCAGCGKSGQDGQGRTQDAGAPEQGGGQNGENEGREDEGPSKGGDGGQLSEGNGGEKEPGRGSGSEEGENSDHQAAARVPENLRVGDVLEDGDLRVVYMESGIYEEAREYLQPESGYQYIFLHFCFENTSKNDDLSIPLFSFVCYADGFEAEGYYGGTNDLASWLSAGRTTTGSLYYQVPCDAKEIDVEYRPKYIEQEALPPSGKVHFLYEGVQKSGYEPPVLTARKEGALKVGGVAETKKERVTFLSCETDDADNEFVHPEQGFAFYTLSFEIENIQKPGSADSDAELAVTSYDFSCYADGVSCRAAYFRDDYITADLDPGRRTKGTVTFEVPDSAKTVEAEYKPSDQSAGRLIFTVR